MIRRLLSARNCQLFARMFTTTVQANPANVEQSQESQKVLPLKIFAPIESIERVLPHNYRHPLVSFPEIEKLTKPPPKLYKARKKEIRHSAYKLNEAAFIVTLL